MCSYSSVFSFPPKLTMAQLRHLEIVIDTTGWIRVRVSFRVKVKVRVGLYFGTGNFNHI